ncbi:MAG TPA: tryptophan--tRNA ligase [Bacteroidales bacterium]|jgi:tryptophanyl-tRNA synthetase|nr:tryptophan--tRNA ligase [Bacteroidales bacterium]MDD4234468.1 tryptophan--tRNA ligase [Bacteroidales bacterium]MDY0159702.1 tryptophan--tRNA ligase [Bacteroidales bacterium]HRW20361.1 tryptophan--tRNA ligase [Bacteroidales bacterium]HXK80631.1 tryptophan--tRNA ligase [Bacteroidales bacterium]
MKTVLSGIRSTGNLHLGNYFGAVKNFVKMQHQNKCYFFIADYHSLTTHPTPQNLHKNVRQVLVEYLAAGLDPELATLYVQSDVPEISELYLLLNMNAYLGELERTTSFKDKARKQPDNLNAGLLTYPVLMAADILIHNSHYVPVGKDQEQHLEMARKFARRFNNMYKCNFFNEPEPYNFGEALIKIPGLDGTGKMGKSEGNGIFLIDEDKTIRKKLMRAVTDQGPTTPNSTPPEPVENLFKIMKIVSDEITYKFFKEQYANCSIRYGDMKKQLAEDLIKLITPLRENIYRINSDNDYIRKVASIGAERARESAGKTLKEVRKIMGFKSF